MYWTQGLHRAVQQQPDAPATVYGSRTRTYAELTARVARLAGALRELGVRDGARVAVLSLNSDRFTELLLAIPWADGVLSPFSIRWGPAEAGYALADSGAGILVVDDAFAELVPVLADRAPGPRTVVHAGDGPTPAGMLGFADLVARAAPIEDARRGGDALAALVYTGGTTGVAKGVMIGHGALVGSMLAIEASAPSDRATARTLVATPMSHMSGLMSALLPITFGGTQVIVPRFDPATVLAAVESDRASQMFLVPSMLRTVLDHPSCGGSDLSSMRHVMYGAAPIDAALLDRAMAAFPGASFQQVYAATESGAAGTLLTPDDHRARARLTSAGRPMVGVEVRILDESGAARPPGAVGEIGLRGPVMLGYWNRPAETAEALRDGWLHTGDAGYLDEAGYLHIVDRVKDMIVTGGGNVYSVEVEKVLARHPAVASCAVIGVPDPATGERVHAMLVLRPGARLDLDGIRRHCRGAIADYKLPCSYEVIDALPLSAAGKPLKHRLREPHWAGQPRRVH
ncbi:MAG TPA: AMP-binding protein [Pseudonocardia sp.]|nr:AMP-binding protein [Pseudonocardia sp.]